MIKCKVCGARINVAGADAEDQDLPESTRQTSGKHGRKGSKRSKSKGGNNQQTLLVAGIGVASVLAVVALLIFLFTRGGQAPGGADVAAGGQPVAAAGSEVPQTTNSAAAVNAAPVAPGWQVQVDPPSVDFTWPEEVKLTIPIPAGDGLLYYPSTRSPFVLLGATAHESAGAQLWNLATGKPVGQIRDKPALSNLRAISPDGKYMALQSSGKPSQIVIELWSFETGKLVRTFTDDNVSSSGYMDFGPNNLLCCHTYHRANGGKLSARFKVWDSAQGTLVREIPDTSLFSAERNAWSPGRRYLACTNGAQQLTVIDLVEGRIAGTAQLPKTSTSGAGSPITPQDVRFSIDGTSIFVLLHGLTETRIVKVDSKTGQHDPGKDIVFPENVIISIPSGAAYKGPKLECLPDDCFLIAGSLWIDKSGQTLWQVDYVPKEYLFEKRFPVPNGLVATVGTYQEKNLVVLEAPWKGSTPQ